MPSRAGTQPQRKATTRHERAGGTHAAPRRHEHAARRVAGHGCVGGGLQRVQDGLVSDDAASAAREPACGGVEHAADQWPVQRGRSAGYQASFDQSGSVQRAGSSADRRRESVSHGAQQLAGTGLEGMRLEQLADGLKSDGHIVAMIAISEDRVESRQVRPVALDLSRTAHKVRANVFNAHRWKRRTWRPRDEGRFGAGRQGGASVATLSSRSNGAMCSSDALRLFYCVC